MLAGGLRLDMLCRLTELIRRAGAEQVLQELLDDGYDPSYMELAAGNGDGEVPRYRSKHEG